MVRNNAREVKAGFWFDRASEGELKERHTVKICRRGTALQYGNEEENKGWIQEVRVSRDEGRMKGAIW